jgi:microcystin-dependent protein
MANPFISMIEAFGFNFAPRGWALCAGQTLPINQNQALFALLGTTFGGNGQTTFNLPDLRGRLTLGSGKGRACRRMTSAQPAGRRPICC